MGDEEQKEALSAFQPLSDEEYSALPLDERITYLARAILNAYRELEEQG